MEEPSQILKTDAIGRVRTPRQRREALLDEFERSGMSASAFAKFCGVNYQTFATWAQQRRRRRKAEKASAAPRLVEAVIARAKAPPSAQGLTVRLTVHMPGGARMEIGDVAQAKIAAELLRALGAGGAGC